MYKTIGALPFVFWVFSNIKFVPCEKDRKERKGKKREAGKRHGQHCQTGVEIVEVGHSGLLQLPQSSLCTRRIMIPGTPLGLVHLPCLN